jgi:hypothetical protein
MTKYWKLLFFVGWMGLASLYAEPVIDWLDLPWSDYKVILAIDEPEIEHLNERITEYHALDKCSAETLSSRIDCLESISAYLQFLAAQKKFVEKKPLIFLLNEAIQGKQEYLRQIWHIPSDEEIAHYHLGPASSQEGDWMVFPLRNTFSYSIKMKEYWGSFWLESIDPCHRRLANYYQFWLNTHPASISYQTFFLWLESQLIPRNILTVKYYSDQQLESCRIEVNEGYLKKSDGQELAHTDPTKRNLFVISLSKNLYVEAHKEGVWHTSLSRGKPVLGAGLLQIDQGVITMVAFESGHYLPSLEHGFQTLQILREEGCRFKEPFDVIYFENRNKYKVSLLERQMQKYQDFDEAIHDPSKRELLSSNEF